jgi:cytosine/adenosine deaminase-related metal-dependent hydrolase
MYRNSQLNQLGASGAQPVTVYVAGGVRDAAGLAAAPGAVAVVGDRVLVAGPAGAVLDQIPPDASRIDLPDHLLLPGLVNAHVHLDLTDIGPLPYPGSFIDWIRHIIAHRPRTPDAIASAVARGAALSRSAGVLTVGDIAGELHALTALAQTDLRGVSFIELIGLDETSIDHIRRLSAAFTHPDLAQPRSAIRPGASPHAPYSTGPFIYGPADLIAQQLRAPFTTHLAETLEEAQFVADATGPFRELIESLGRWDDRLLDHYGSGDSPVHWFTRHVTTPSLLAHCNHVGDFDMAMLAEAGHSVAYCPRASDYFGHRRHRYRDMIEAGINVCLGTDSIVCHGSLSILDEMRHLHARDGTDPALLLKMATMNGLRALRLDEHDATFGAGASPGIVAVAYDRHSTVDPLQQVLDPLCPSRPDSVRVVHWRTGVGVTGSES